MTDGHGNKIGFLEMMRFGTPLLVTICIFLSGLLINKIDKIDDKIFKHLTNDDLHALRSTLVSKAEFELNKQFTEKYYEHVVRSIEDIRCDLKYITEKKMK